MIDTTAQKETIGDDVRRCQKMSDVRRREETLTDDVLQ